MMIRNANRNISVAKGHGYTLEKVKFAVNFVQKSGRNTTINDWVAAYNYIKDANETAQGCQACKAAKFTAAVRNYARYGYMTLLNEGYKPEDFTDAASSDVERKETVKVDEISKVDATEPEVVSTVTETAGQGEPTVELPIVEEPDAILAETTENGCIEEKQPETVAEQKPKVRRRKNDKSDNK